MQVLRPTRQIYDTSVLRRTPRGQVTPLPAPTEKPPPDQPHAAGSASAFTVLLTPSLPHHHLDAQTFDQVIQLGVDNPESTVGCIAGDEDAYATFPEFFVNVVEKLGIQRRYVHPHRAGVARHVFHSTARPFARSLTFRPSPSLPSTKQ